MKKRKKQIFMLCCIMIITTGITACGSKNHDSSSVSNETDSDIKIQETVDNATDFTSEDSMENKKHDTDETEQDSAMEKSHEETEEVKQNMESEELSYDFSTDVEKGLLYSTEDGKISDKNGDVISEYAYITVLENGALSDGENIIEAYGAGAGGKIFFEIPKAAEYSDEPKSLPAAYESNCAVDTVMNDAGSYTYMADDGNYFDEVILGTWFNENGSPRAKGFPYTLDRACNPNFGTSGLDDFKFIDGSIYTLDDVKRGRTTVNDLTPTITALLISNLQKENRGEEIVYVGYEYMSDQPVVVHGSFDGILNGDNVLLFGTYTGLGSDDTPNFRGYYIENEGDRF